MNTTVVFLIGCTIFIILFLGFIAILMQMSPKVRNIVGWIMMIVHDIVVFFDQRLWRSMILDYIADRFKIPIWLQILLLTALLGTIVFMFLPTPENAIAPNAAPALQRVY